MPAAEKILFKLSVANVSVALILKLYGFLCNPTATIFYL